MVAGRLDLLRFAVVSILSVGLSSGVADDLPRLARVKALGDAFSVAVMGLRAHTFSNYIQYAVDPGSAWRAVRYGQPRHRLVGERAHARCAAIVPCCCPSPCWYGF